MPALRPHEAARRSGCVVSARARQQRVPPLLLQRRRRRRRPRPWRPPGQTIAPRPAPLPRFPRSCRLVCPRANSSSRTGASRTGVSCSSCFTWRRLEVCRVSRARICESRLRWRMHQRRGAAAAVHLRMHDHVCRLFASLLVDTSTLRLLATTASSASSALASCRPVCGGPGSPRTLSAGHARAHLARRKTTACLECLQVWHHTVRC